MILERLSTCLKDTKVYTFITVKCGCDPLDIIFPFWRSMNREGKERNGEKKSDKCLEMWHECHNPFLALDMKRKDSLSLSDFEELKLLFYAQV